MAKKKVEIDIKGEMYARVRTVYWIFIFVGLAVMVRLVWVMLPITETAENADRLEERIFQTDTVISPWLHPRTRWRAAGHIHPALPHRLRYG